MYIAFNILTLHVLYVLPVAESASFEPGLKLITEKSGEVSVKRDTVVFYNTKLMLSKYNTITSQISDFNVSVFTGIKAKQARLRLPLLCKS